MRDRVPNLTMAVVVTAAIATVPAPAVGQEAPADSAQAEGEIGLVYERESFTYPAQGRRDPFASLIGVGLGPRLEDLTIGTILYAEDRSVVVLIDASSGESYRARIGQTVGNARVIDIQPERVMFAVEEFGVVHQEMLELKRNRGQGTEQ